MTFLALHWPGSAPNLPPAIPSCRGDAPSQPHPGPNMGLNRNARNSAADVPTAHRSQFFLPTHSALPLCNPSSPPLLNTSIAGSNRIFIASQAWNPNRRCATLHPAYVPFSPAAPRKITYVTSNGMSPPTPSTH